MDLEITIVLSTIKEPTTNVLNTCTSDHHFQMARNNIFFFPITTTV